MENTVCVLSTSFYYPRFEFNISVTDDLTYYLPSVEYVYELRRYSADSPRGGGRSETVPTIPASAVDRSTDERGRITLHVVVMRRYVQGLHSPSSFTSASQYVGESESERRVYVGLYVRARDG
jgi:hypothetical protein